VLNSLLDKEKLDLVKYDEWGRDASHPFITLTPEQQARAYVYVQGEEIPRSSIPALRRAQIVKALQESGLPVTELAIAQYWVRAGRPK
jgi:hypothetical protein